MAKLKFSIHPLFFAFGIYFALIGKVFSFIIFVLTAVIHEFGHYLASERYGYQLNRVVLMPYGAVVSGEMQSLKYRDEIIVAFCGPLINFIIVIFCTALWWILPEAYAYTDIIVTSNLAIAAINLLPCYPLDGGRILSATLSLYMTRKTAALVCKIIGFLTAIALFALFIYSCFSTLNITVLFFALFVLSGVLSKSDKNKYIRICDSFSNKKYQHGVDIKSIAISGSAPLKEIYRLARECAVELTLLNEKGEIIKTLNFIEVQNLLESNNIYERIDNLY